MFGILGLMILNGNHFYKNQKNLDIYDNKNLTNNPELVAGLIAESKDQSKKILWANLAIISGLVIFHVATKGKSNSK